MTFEPEQDEFASVCPYLGLADDADSHATYATEAHRCYRMPTATRIASGHQETYCLGANHETCPVFLGEGVSGPPAVQRQVPRPLQPAAPPIRPSREAAPRATAPRPAAQRPPRRPALTGTTGPRPRSGGISMPAATIGLFVMAIVVIAIAFLIQRAVNDNGDNKLSVSEQFQTAQALRTAAGTPGGQPTLPPATQTALASQSPQAQTPGTGTPATTRTTTPGTTTPAGGTKTYTVQAGDTCGKIAADNNITLQQLMNANNITNPDCPINVGDVLKIP